MAMAKNTTLADLLLQSSNHVWKQANTGRKVEGIFFGSDILFSVNVPLLRVPGAPLNLFYIRKVMLGFISIKKTYNFIHLKNHVIAGVDYFYLS